jgi:hypothetical protein
LENRQLQQMITLSEKMQKFLNLVEANSKTKLDETVKQ